MAAAGTLVSSAKFEALAARLVESGRYNSVSEVLEAAVDALEREECEDEVKLEHLQRPLKKAKPAEFTRGTRSTISARNMAWPSGYAPDGEGQLSSSCCSRPRLDFCLHKRTVE